MDGVEELNANVKSLTAATQRLGSVANTASVTITGGGMMGMVLAALGLAGIGLGLHLSTVSEIRHQAAMEVLAAGHRADMAELKSIRSVAESARDQASTAKTMAQQFRMDMTTKLATLEAKK